MQGTKPVLHNTLRKLWTELRFVCVGLDVDVERIPTTARTNNIASTIVKFNRAIIDATQGHVCAYKPNAAFYERHGTAGIDALAETVRYIKEQAPEVPVILDVKRGDIDSSSVGYATAAFDIIGADAVTIHPYLGYEASRPFLDRPDRGAFVLVKTSNPGAGEFQDLPVGSAQRPLYEHVARRVAETWNANGNCGVVVGATYPDALRAVRAVVGDLPILVPGIGAQHGDLHQAVLSGRDSEGQGLIINASRSIIYASVDVDYAEVARLAVAQLNQEVVAALNG